MNGYSQWGSIKRVLLAMGASVPALVGAIHQTETLDWPIRDGRLPYTLEFSEVSLAPADIQNLHSVAAGALDGLWVLLAGRTNGLHGLTGLNAFDPQFENREVWVIDPAGRRSWRRSPSQVWEDTPVTPEVVVANEQVILAWPSAEGVTYLLESGADLRNWQEQGPAVTGDGGTREVSVPRPKGERQFYRVLSGAASLAP